MKLNNKGYFLVEIIVASVLAMTLAYFLLEITIDIKNINDDSYVETILETDKVLMTRDVMNDINTMDLKEIEVYPDNIIFTFIDIDGNEKVKKMEIINNIFKYGTYNTNNNTYESDVFVKTINKNLNIGTLMIDNATNELIIDIPAKTNYSDYNYGINLDIPYKEGELKININYPGTEVANNLYYTSFDGSDSNEATRIFAYNNGNKNEISYSSSIPKGLLERGYNSSGYTLDINATANNKYLYYTNFYAKCSGSKCNSYIYSVSISRCENDGGSCSIIKEDIAYAPINTSLTSQLTANSKYLYYTGYIEECANSKCSSTRSRMYIYRCNVDGSDCTHIQTTVPVAIMDSKTSINSSLNPQIYATENYLYYTSNIESYKMGVYRCNIEGTDCNNIAVAQGVVGQYNNPYNPLLAANSNNLYYTSYKEECANSKCSSKKGYMDIYRCSNDSSNCTVVATASPAIVTSVGGAFNPQIAVNDDKLYYTSYGTVCTNSKCGSTKNVMNLYYCNSDGTNCQTNSYASVAYETGYALLNPQIAIDSTNHFYYTSYGTVCTNTKCSSTKSAMHIYKCDENIEVCENIASPLAIYEYKDCGSAAGGSTSTYCTNIAFARKNPLIITNK